RKEGDDFLLSGESRYVVDGHTAGLIVVAARPKGGDGVSLFALPGETAGLTRAWLPTLDQTRKKASLSFDGVRLPKSALLGEEEKASPIIDAVRDRAIAALAVEGVGGAEACLDMAVEYAKERKQFGRAIGSFQSIKHICADMLTRVEAARSIAYFAGLCA